MATSNKNLTVSLPSIEGKDNLALSDLTHKARFLRWVRRTAPALYAPLREWVYDAWDKFNLFILAILITAFASVGGVILAAHPLGMVGLIGSYLAGYAFSRGLTEFAQVYPGFVVAVLIIVELSLTTIMMLLPRDRFRDEVEGRLDGIEAELEEIKHKL